MPSIKHVQIKDNEWLCPDNNCDYTTEKISNLRKHVKRHHKFRITTVSTWHLTKEQKRRSKNKADRERKRKKPKKKRRPLFDIDTVLTRGTFQCQDPIVSYKKSSISNAGNGVFTNTDIRKGDFITIYSGENMDDKPIDAEYVIQLQDGSYVIGNSTPQPGNGLGSFINRSAVKKIVNLKKTKISNYYLLLLQRRSRKGMNYSLHTLVGID